MKRMERFWQLRLSSKEILALKRLAASMMLPITIFYASSLHVVVTVAAAEEVASTVEEKEDPAPKEEEKETVKEETPTAKDEPAEQKEEVKAQEKTAPVEDVQETPETEPAPTIDLLTEPEGAITSEDVVPATDDNTIVSGTAPASEPVVEPIDPPADTITIDPVIEEPVVPDTEMETWKENKDESYTTNEAVVLDREYVFPKDDKVIIKFTKLPETPGTITIKEIELTNRQRAEIGSLSQKAYDITSDMADGSFEFSLTLPLPEGKISADQVEVKYAEKISDLPKAESTEKDKDVEEKLDTKDDTLTVKGVDHLTIFFIATAAAIPDANVAEGLASMGPINQTTGLPEWYEDNNGQRLVLCDNVNDPNCGAPVPEEAFYWMAESTIPMPGKGNSALLTMALEMTDLDGIRNTGDEAVFTRLRIRVDAPVAGDYTIIHPFGNKTYTNVAAGSKTIDDTIDINVNPFPGAGVGSIGPFLTAVTPADPAGYIGNPNLEQTVTGSPSGNNYFEIQGPVGADFDGQGHNGVQNEHFVLLGKIYVDPAVLAVGVNSQVVDTTTPTITGTFSGDITHDITIDVKVGATPGSMQTIPGANIQVDTTNKTWSANVPADFNLTNGTYEVEATATDNTAVPIATITDTTTNELTVDTTPVPVTNTTGLAARSPLINAQTGYPEWYQDTLGTKLALCADPADPMCLVDPVITGNTLSESTGFGGEAFYWNGESIINFPNGGQALLVMALEAAYGTGDPAPNEQMVFARIRVRIDAPVAGDYTVTHPFGSKTYTAAAGIRTINDTIDIGTVTIGTFPGAFDSALNGNVGPFLKAVSPAPPAGYIGSPLLEQTVKGSPFGTNFFRIEGPADADLGGTGTTPNIIQKNRFTLSGKLFVEPPVGTLSVSVTPLNTTTATPTISGGVSDPTATVTISVAGQNISATVDPATGAWSVTIPAPITPDGTYDVVATATVGATTVTDATTNELVVNTAPDATGLTAVGPTAATGFPVWYRDQNNVQLGLCNDSADPLCVTTPVIAGNTVSEQAGFGDEAFFWNGTSTIDLPNGGQAKLVTGLEAAYANGTPAVNDQMVFTRVRIIVDAPVAGDYIVTHPFGTKTYTVTPAEVGVGAINDTVDIGAVSVGTLATAFSLALNGNIGPFLTAVDPIPPAGYIGDPGILQTVAGSLAGNNFFRIEGPAGSNLDLADGDNIVVNDKFSLSGKIAQQTLTSIVVTPANPALIVGATQQMAAAALDQAGNPIDPAPVVSWSSNNEAVATVDAATGVVTAISTGTATITATNGAISGLTTVFVTDPSQVLTQIIVTPDPATAIVGSTQQFNVQALDQNGAPMAVPITWSTNDPAVATIDQTGLLTAVATGTVTVTALSGGVSGTATLTVDPKTITVTVDANQTKVYGTADPALTYISSDPTAVFTGSLTRAAGEVVGTYAISLGSLSAGPNFTITFIPADFTITQSAITVTADPQSKVVGTADPVLTYQVTSGALVAGDSFTGSLSRVAGEDVGTYAITQGTLALNGNYTLIFVGNDLAIAQTSLTVTVDANQTKVYGTADPALTYISSDPTAVFTGSLTRAAGEVVGTYAISLGSLSAGPNFTITFIPADFTITQSAITVTADPQTKVYGAADPALTYQVTSGALVGTDAFTGTLTRDAGENVGTYAINQGTLVLNGNYTLAFVGNDLTISLSTLTVTADNQTKLFGNADPDYTFAYAGFVGGDTAAVIDTPPTCGVSVAHTNVGTYPITCSGGVDNNYSFNYVDGTLTVDLTPDQTTPDANGAAALNPTTPEVVITDPNQAVTVTIDKNTTNPTINLSSFVTGGSGIIPQITINSDLGNVVIPASTTVTSADPSWDGVIAAPTITTVNLPKTSGKKKTVNQAIEIGFSGAMLSFDKAVRILFPDQAGNRIGYVRTGTTFTEITTICSADNQAAGDALIADGECKIDEGNDLVVWTKHFTKFATYTQVSSESDDDDDDSDDDDDDDEDRQSKKRSTNYLSMATGYPIAWAAGSSNVDGDKKEDSSVTDTKEKELSSDGGGMVAGDESSDDENGADPADSPFRKALPYVGVLILIIAGGWWLRKKK